MKAGCVLFDLDGTLVDTAPDLANALNQALANHGKPPLPFKEVRPSVSLGGAAMLQLGFGVRETDPGFTALRDEFLDIYRNSLADHSRLFPGMEQTLAAIEERGLPWGVVTNKPGWLTNPLMRRLELDERTRCIVCGDTLERRKPHPDPLLHACKLLRRAPEESLYVGDARRDIEAGRSAGTMTLVAAYGYLDNEDDPLRWEADGLIDSPLEVLDWLEAGAL